MTLSWSQVKESLERNNMIAFHMVKIRYKQDKTNVAVTLNHTVVIIGEWKFGQKQHDFIVQGQENVSAR
jgi:hypothetical protein